MRRRCAIDACATRRHRRGERTSGYSAAADAEDLAGLIAALHLGPAFIVGRSYGALTTLLLARRHPELVRAAVLAEPPAVSLLRTLHDDPAAGRAMDADLATRLVAPMKAAFAAGDTEIGVATFIDYVFGIRTPG